MPMEWRRMKGDKRGDNRAKISKVEALFLQRQVFSPVFENSTILWSVLVHRSSFSARKSPLTLITEATKKTKANQ